eukprot:m.323767 g.323767  ORF g.323767 m.323767 type:complete len:822 (-) comp27627_c0_seq4:5995-8460(-)
MPDQFLGRAILDLAKRADICPLPPIVTSKQSEHTGPPVWMSAETLDHKKHFDRKQVAKAFECLMTALSIDQPANPRAYLLEKIVELRGTGLVYWDQLIEPSRRPERPIRPYWLVENDPWDDYVPTKEMIMASNAFNVRRLLKYGLCEWQAGVECNRLKKILVIKRLTRATQRRKREVKRNMLTLWLKWTTDRNNARRHAFAVQQKRVDRRLLHTVVAVWLRFTQEMKAQKAWLKSMADKEDEEEQLGTTVAGGAAISVEDPISTDMPWDLRVHIFTFLGVVDLCRCARTCRSWYDVVQDPTLWSAVNFSSLQQYTSDSVLERLVSKFRPVVTNINLQGCTLVGQPTCFTLSECSNLQDVNLAGCLLITDSGMKELVQSCRSLLYLNVACTKITDLSLLYLATYAMPMECLSLAYCEDLTDAGAISLSSGVGCRSLRHLDLSGCRRFSSEGFVHIIKACAAGVEALLIDNVPALHDVVLQAIGQTCCGTIEKLSLDNCVQSSDKGLKAIAACVDLRSFTYTHNKMSTGSGLRSLLRGAKGMNVLDIAGSRCALGSEGLLAIGVTHITTLDLSENCGIRDQEVKALCDAASKLKGSLVALDLAHCTGITAVGFEMIFRRLTSLTTLVIRGCTGLEDHCFVGLDETQLVHLDLSECLIGDDALFVLGQCIRETLTDLRLDGCIAITDYGIQSLVKGCKFLATLHLSGCANLSDDAVVAIAFALGKGKIGTDEKPATLSSLNLQGCTGLTDQSLQCICASNPNLQTLNLFGITNITGKAAERNLATLKRLRHLILSDDGHIGLGSVNKLRQKHPHLDIYFDSYPL